MTAVQQAKAVTRRDQMNEVAAMFDSRIGMLEQVLPNKRAAQRFVRVAVTAVQMNPELLECDPRSLWNACMRCASAGHLPDGQDAALVVFKDKTRGKIAQHFPMRRGITRQILKSGDIATIEVGVVHEQDVWVYERGDNPVIRHVPKPGNGKVVAAYSIATFKTGEKSREWMWRDDIEKRRAVARSDNVWTHWYEEMCEKTVLKRHAKVLPTSTDTDLMLARDDELMHGEREIEDDDDALPGLAPARRIEPANDLAARLDQIAGLDDPASEAAVDQGDITERAMDGVSDDADKNFATAVTRHAQTLTAAAKDGPLALSSAWERIPTPFKSALKDTYDNLQLERVSAK